MTVADLPAMHARWVSEDRGVGLAAGRLRSLYESIGARSPSIQGERYREVLQALEALIASSSEAGWDGYDGLPVASASYQLARRFLRQLPGRFPVPELAIDPDGEINLEWSTERADHNVTLSIGPDVISFAGIFGRNRIHGVEEYTGGIPTAILTALARLYPTRGKFATSADKRTTEPLHFLAKRI
jgi:hypothetical protein